MRRTLAGLALSLLLAAPAQALQTTGYPELEQFIQNFSAQNQYPQARLRKLFAQARIRSEILSATERPKEALPWYDYRKIFLTDDQRKRGAQFWTRNRDALARATERYGVPAEIIVAIIGIETQYGRNPGDFPVIDALTTLWLYYPPRADFFRHELEEFLLLTRELGVDPLSVKGSYAGALGMPQFISSSYRRYAVDFDNDGKRDLFKSAADAIGSVANFLQVHGWETGAPIFDEVELRGTRYFWIERLGLKPALSVGDLAEYGIVPRANPALDRRAALIALEGEMGPFYRLGYTNFHAITYYNRSKRYAMAVAELAGRLRRDHEES
jgi:membrane-bound lytic murein transglycosylase B